MAETIYSVLLLGEESYNRQLLVDLLRQRGHAVFKARSAANAEAYLAGKVDVVVVDQRVRGTSGLAWIRTMRGRGLTVPVVFCSASSCSAKTINVLRSVHNVSFIAHAPIVPMVLANQIESLLPEYGERPVALDSDVLQFSPGSGCNSAAPEADLLEIPLYIDEDSHNSQVWQQQQHEAEETLKALEELGKAYVSDMPEMLYEMRNQISSAMQAGQCSDLLQAATTTAHQMKGTAGSLGFPELSRLAGQIEALLESVSENFVPGPLASALIVVADIENWIESFQDDCTDATLNVGPSVSLSAQATPPESVADARPESEFDTLSESKSESKSERKSKSLPETVAVLEREFEAISGSGSAPDSEPIYIDMVPKASYAQTRVFIVDNSELSVQSLTKILKGQGGYQVQSMNCSVKVLAAMEEYEPDLVIVDADGDDLSGFDICRMIRCHPRWERLHIILMTADTHLDCRRAIYKSGASDFIVKPLMEEELVNRLSFLPGRQLAIV